MTTTPIGHLTTGMKHLARSGAGKDLQLSEEACEKYTNLIKDYRHQLKEHRKEAAGLTKYGNVGNFWSALQTKKQLIDDVTGPEGILKSLDKYIEYLDHFEDAVKAACNRLQADDKR